MTSRTLSTATYVAPFVQTSKVLISKSPSELRNTSFGAALPSTLVLAINHHLVSSEDGLLPSLLLKTKFLSWIINFK
ncbi:hypothetical protein GLOIN_2v1765531 [Rhizophagus irregularis DAOM 181602=DAOM 197198]|nr:hypothetical protein GLOIN_2v1765531 [Rhizophagus irregularis DAOM 181602=DAOM 197198]